MSTVRPSLIASLLCCIALCVAEPSYAQGQSRSASLVFIADDVPEGNQLAAGVVPGTEVVRLRGNEDALVQIGQALSSRRDIGTIALVSHGSAGALHFGSSRVGTEELARRAVELRGWRASLATGADVLLYGCDVGAGSTGAAFLSALSTLTGADVAASTNATGGTAQSDWILERHVGRVTASPPWPNGVLAHWGHRLTVVAEPPDFSNTLAGAPVIILTSGANRVSGMVTTPSDGQDNFQVTVPVGFRLTAAALTLNTSGGFNGSVTFNLNETLTASGNFTLGLPLSPGTYYVQVIANFSVGNAWSMAFTLTPFATCGNGIIEPGEACDDGNTVSCDGCSATCTVDVNGCLVGGACLAEGTVSPTNACLACVRAVSRTAYSPVANGTACNDGDACTQSDSCQAGTCTGANPVVCAAAAPCHTAGVCNPATGVCSTPIVANGTACNDGNACTQTDTCQAGACTGTNPVTCTAADPCHAAGVCNAASGVCSAPAAADGTTCNDGNACSRTDTCQAGVCTGANPVLCTAADPCHVAGVCSPTTGACSAPVAPNGTACIDGNACTQTDTCQGGVCTGANPVVCTAADPCHVAGVCSPTTGVCSAPIAANGTACNDGNACSQTDTCQTGVCTGSNPVTCTPADQCHVAGTCDPSTGTCSTPFATSGTACNDGLFCTAIDTCNGVGACTGTTRDCSDANVCTVDTCDETAGMCNSTAIPGCGDAGVDAGVDAEAGTDAGEDADVDAEAGTEDAGIDAGTDGGASDGGDVSVDTGARDASDAGVRGDVASDGRGGDGGTGVASPGCGCRVGSTSSGARSLFLGLLLALSLAARRRRPSAKH